MDTNQLKIKIVTLFFFSILFISVVNLTDSEIYGTEKKQYFVHGSPSLEDDWAEPNDNQGEAYVLNYGFHTNFVCLNDDWYQLGILLNHERLTIDLRYNSSSSLNLELFDEASNPFVYNLTEQTWGKSLVFIATSDISMSYLKISGSTNDSYDMDVIVDGNDFNPMTPSLEWIAFSEGSWAEWDAKFTIIDSNGGENQSEGKLRGTIQSISLTDFSVAVDAEMLWEGMPDAYMMPEDDEMPEDLELNETGEIFPSSYHFDINPEHQANPPYFGFASPFMGSNFQFKEFNPLFTMPDTSYTIGDEGKSVVIEYNGTDAYYFKTIANYSDEGLLTHLGMEQTDVDENNVTTQTYKMELMLSDSDLSENSDNLSKSDDNGLGFDLENIPGYSSEFLLGIFGISLIAILSFQKLKTRH
ncbi:hypothetical protein [Candidatus Lokiarchaeum ossiferum]|uniref:hypothetical protein n=1 Tax=Candidatus Lokiarchaeum ossiferum TaxID=2951803 RepID=UPI00352F6C05